MKAFFSNLIQTFNWNENFLQSFGVSTVVNDGKVDPILLRLWGLQSKTSETVSFKFSSVCCLCVGDWLTVGLDWSLDCNEDPPDTKCKQCSCCLLLLTVLELTTTLDSLLSFTMISSSLESSAKIILDNFFFECAQFCLIFICFTACRVLYFLLSFAKHSSFIMLKSIHTSSLDWLLQDSSSSTQKLSSI